MKLWRIIFVFSLLGLAACQTPATATPVPVIPTAITNPTAVPVNTVAIPTAMVLPTASIATETATTAPTPLPVPTVTAPPATAVVAPTHSFNIIRIQLPAGTTTQVLPNENAAANSINQYTLRANAGQTLSLNLFPTPFTASLSVGVFGAEDGRVLLQTTSQENFWVLPLPTTQDYVIQIGNLDPNTSTAYALNIGLPYRIQFDAGAISADVQGQIVPPNSTLNEYVLGAQAGQTMHLKIVSPDSNVWLTVVAPDGSPLVRSVMGLSEWSDVLPATGDYQIHATLLDTAVTTPVLYTLQVTITN